MEQVCHCKVWLISENAQLCQCGMKLILVIRTMMNTFMQESLLHVAFRGLCFDNQTIFSTKYVLANLFI